MEKSWVEDSYTGWYTFTGNENLWFVTAANVAETPRVVTITPYINATATTPTGGYFQIAYNIPQYPGSRRSFISAPIPYGATAGAINTAIANMLIPDISVSVGSSTMSSLLWIGINYLWNQHFEGLPYSLSWGRMGMHFRVKHVIWSCKYPSCGYYCICS